MTRQDTAKTGTTSGPAPKKLTLTKETLRRLTPAELRLAAGGLSTGSRFC